MLLFTLCIARYMILLWATLWVKYAVAGTLLNYTVVKCSSGRSRGVCISVSPPTPSPAVGHKQSRYSNRAVSNSNKGLVVVFAGGWYLQSSLVHNWVMEQHYHKAHNQISVQQLRIQLNNHRWLIGKVWYTYNTHAYSEDHYNESREISRKVPVEVDNQSRNLSYVDTYLLWYRALNHACT